MPPLQTTTYFREKVGPYIEGARDAQFGMDLDQLATAIVRESFHLLRAENPTHQTDQDQLSPSQYESERRYENLSFQTELQELLLIQFAQFAPKKTLKSTLGPEKKQVKSLGLR